MEAEPRGSPGPPHLTGKLADSQSSSLPTAGAVFLGFKTSTWGSGSREGGIGRGKGSQLARVGSITALLPVLYLCSIVDTYCVHAKVPQILLTDSIAVLHTVRNTEAGMANA